MLSDATMVVIIAVYLFVQSPTLAAITLTPVPLIVYLSRRFGARIYRVYHRIWRKASRMHATTRALLENELDQRYFIPLVITVNSFRLKLGVQSWEVVTDRGPRAFDVRERDDYRVLPTHRLLIRDVDGNRYEIPDYTALDPRTVDAIEQVL